jgi:hypothetical protein
LASSKIYCQQTPSEDHQIAVGGVAKAFLAPPLRSQFQQLQNNEEDSRMRLGDEENNGDPVLIPLTHDFPFLVCIPSFFLDEHLQLSGEQGKTSGRKGVNNSLLGGEGCPPLTSEIRKAGGRLPLQGGRQGRP